MGMLSSLTSSFSRSNINLSASRQASGSSTQAAMSTSVRTNPPLPLFTTNMRQIHTAQPNSYWCGRFQALSDRFHSEVLDACLLDSEMLQQYVTASSSSSSSPPPFNSKGRGKAKSKGVEETEGTQKLLRSTTTDDITEDHDRRSNRAFIHLQALCTTNEAKNSLWQFQLLFARMEGKPKLLPTGGKMSDERAGWVSRVGRAMGARTAMGLGKRKDSMLGIGARQ
jgi:hypothetical protein